MNGYKSPLISLLNENKNSYIVNLTIPYASAKRSIGLVFSFMAGQNNYAEFSSLFSIILMF